MRDLFLDDGVEMEQGNPMPAPAVRDALAGRYVCPFCGIIKDQADAVCPRCTMENSAATRQATKGRIGPWYVLQSRNPAAPGMKFDTLMSFVRKGRIKPRSVVRGPTTHQLWRFAAQVKGLSREFGVCYSCGGAIERTARLCPHCNRAQDPPENPDVYLEGQEPGPAGPIPVFRDLGAPSLVAEDIATPANRGQQSTGRADGPQTASRNSGEGFLSAKDLAAAFKLHFHARQDKSGHPVSSPQPAASPPQPVRRPTVRRKRRKGRVMLVLLVLAALGAYAFEYERNAGVRSKSQQMLQATVAWSRQKWSELITQPAGKTPQSKSGQERRAADATPQQDNARPGQPDWDQIFKGQQTVASKPAAAGPADSSQSRDEEGDGDLWTLYRGAIDDEARGDFAAAVKKYQRIKDFSHDLWPRDLELRLKEAQRQAGQ